MKKVIILILFFSLGFLNLCFAQTASEIERTQEILEKEMILREKIEKEEKVFIKKIIVKGVTLLTKEEVKEIILLFQNRWLSKKQIQQILDLLTTAYKQKGYTSQPEKISFQIKRRYLIIHIEELTH